MPQQQIRNQHQREREQVHHRGCECSVIESVTAAIDRVPESVLTKLRGKKSRIQSKLAQYQLKKNESEDVSDMMILIATTGEWNLGCIQPRALGNMFKSPSI